MKRVLIITYYWPPSGGSGVQRWLKMSKYLPENGWQPVIYTAEDAEYPVEDPSLEKDVCPEAEVIRRKIVEPYSFYKKFIGKKKDDKVKAGFINESGSKGGWKEKLSVWIRGNLFIPDARCWWIRPSVRYLKGYLKAHPVDAIISTGPPHSMHLIAMKVHNALGTPWAADFRDPWTEIDYYQDLKLTKYSDKKHHNLEQKVLETANVVTTIGWYCAKKLENKGGMHVKVVPNGYDELPKHEYAELSKKFTISHIGIIGASRNPHTLWQVLSEMAKQDASFDKDLEIRLTGQIDKSVITSLEENGLMDKVVLQPYIPHDLVQKEQAFAQILLLLINDTPSAKGILTGKLFEYLASGRPILCIGPEDGDAARIIADAEAGTTVDFHDKKKMKEVLLKYYERSESGTIFTPSKTSIERYSRRALAKDYSELLDNISK